MFCHKCGEKQSDDTKFCTNYGTPTSKSVVTPTPSSNHNYENDNVKPDSSLSDDVRQKYISELESDNGWWQFIVAIIVSIISFNISAALFGAGWWN
jgi:uncharacterized membrane protein YvbJ